MVVTSEVFNHDLTIVLHNINENEVNYIHTHNIKIVSIRLPIFLSMNTIIHNLFLYITEVSILSKLYTYKLF
jgi:hypothetical protein